MGRIIRKNTELRSLYHQLSSGDVVVTVLNVNRNEEWIFLDLCSRGIMLFPPALAQLLSRSKAFQARVFSQWMVPHTYVISERRQLLEAMKVFHENGVGRVITKDDRSDCGLGIHIWDSVEEVFNHAAYGGLEYPFVLQPFIPGAVDVRVVALGEYWEAYWRKSSCSFRNNLHWGGSSGAYTLSEEQKAMCIEVMKRGQFPYALLDLLIAGNGRCCLWEISLRAGG